MKTTSAFNLNNLHPAWLLPLGTVLITLSHTSFGIDFLAWFASVPFLVYLSKTKGFKSRLLFVFTMIVAFTLAFFKIVTDPIPALLILMFSIPVAFIQVPGYLLRSRFASPLFRSLAFPLAMIILEWVQYSFTPITSWGVAAYTQVDSPAISQSVSLFGMPGLSFLIYWVNAVIAEVILGKSRRMLLVPTGVLASLMIWGALRLDISRSTASESIKVAAVGTDFAAGAIPLPAFETIEDDIRGVFDRTRVAAARGAELVVWNEAAFFLLPENEEAWKDSIASLAVETGAHIVAAYVVPFENRDYHYHNKYVFAMPDGTIDHEYLKHQPVPGEPALAGTEPQQSTQVGNIRVGGAICYDYDVPRIARDNRRAGADVVAVPASDWRGIDPVHTQMAAFRAIEQGQSVVRSTRFGLSAAITPYGVMNAQMSSFESDDLIMMAEVPQAKVTTLFSLVGDLFVWLCMAALAGMIVWSVVPQRANPGLKAAKAA